MKRILVPVDFSQHAEYALEVAAILAKRFDSEILVLHMLGLSEAYLTKDEAQEAAEAHYYMKLARRRFDNFLDKPYLKDLKIREMVQNYKIFSELNQVAIENNIDLIIMGSHGTGGLGELFVGSNTEKVVRTSKIPVLVVKVRRPEFKPSKAVFATDFSSESLEAYQRLTKVLQVWETEVCLVHINLPNERFQSSREKQLAAQQFIDIAHRGELPENTEIKFASDYSVESGVYFIADDIDADLIALATHGRSGLMHFFKGSVGEDMANHAKLPVLTCKI